ncbi:peptidase [Streptomyces sp. AcH 505]|uniref:M23 family metallopeptidase n=1 Tax=unclassified Streptomyces TaxID=2593676 RepID=UPI0005921D26|nr:LysM peptidoglycan-binding domain-containing M23 family metallopeptidase [Streptomyces sp. NBC_00370]KIF71319.1 peptidase [Streptomyces sp. AcH 505]
MPGKGKHRRPKSRSLARGFAAAGAGGAALAMPFIGATGAHAAEHAAPTAAPVKAAPAKAASVRTAPAKAATTYSVVPGDYLSKIAAREQVSGGWHKLYDDNRSVIGSDPSLIRPGTKLTIGAKAPAAAAPSAAAKTTAATATPAAATKQTDGGYTLPVDGAPIGTPYHQNGAMWSSGYHTGTDFVVPTGTTVKAVAAGTVVTAGWGGSYGNQVVIRHSDGDYSQYGHMSSLNVSAGQTVTEGQQIGVSGATGNVTGPHLHFEIRTGPDYGSDIDPLAYLRAHGVTV